MSKNKTVWVLMASQLDKDGGWSAANANVSTAYGSRKAAVEHLKQFAEILKSSKKLYSTDFDAAWPVVYYHDQNGTLWRRYAVDVPVVEMD